MTTTAALPFSDASGWTAEAEIGAIDPGVPGLMYFHTSHKRIRVVIPADDTPSGRAENMVTLIGNAIVKGGEAAGQAVAHAIANISAERIDAIAESLRQMAESPADGPPKEAM